MPPTTPTTPPTTQPDPDPDPNAPPRPAAADPDGKRDLGWRNDGAGMTYLQLEPVNPKDDKAPRKDRVMLWHPPFGKDDVKVVYATPNRITQLQYSDECRTLFLTQTVDNQRQISALNLADPKTVYVIQKGAATTPKDKDAKDKKNPDPDDDDDVGQADVASDGEHVMNG